METNNKEQAKAYEAIELLNLIVKQSFLSGKALEQANDAVKTLKDFVAEQKM